MLPVGLSVGWTHASIQTTAQYGGIAVSSCYNEALVCSDTIDIDPEASPEPARAWRGRYRPGREDPLSCISIFLKTSESRKAAVGISSLDSRPNRRAEKLSTISISSLALNQMFNFEPAIAPIAILACNLVVYDIGGHVRISYLLA